MSLTSTGARLLPRIAACIVLILGTILATAVPASAHAVLEQTTPAAGATLGTAPEQVWLRFNQTVGVDNGSVRVLDPAGDRVDLGDARAGDTGDQVVDDLRTGLQAGVYVVVWKVVSADGHPISGTYLFGAGVAVGREQVSTGGSDGTGPASVALFAGILRFAFETAFAMLLGAGFFLLAVWPRGLDLPSTRRLLLVSWAVGLAAALALLVVQGPYAAGLPLTDALRPSVLGQVWHSRFGHVSQVRLILLLAAFPLVRTFPRRRRTGRFEAAGLAGGLAVAWATIGHASDGHLTGLTVPVLSLHVAVVSAWLGGLAVLALFLLRPAHIDELGEILPRWTRLATLCVGVTAVTGTVLTWRDVGTPPALPGTPYGRFLLVKLVLFAAVMVVAWGSHHWVARRHRLVVHASTLAALATDDSPTHVTGPRPSASQVRALRHRVVAEIAIAVLIFMVTAALANTKTARMAYAPPVNRTTQAGPLHLRLHVSSSWRGPQDLTLQVLDSDGRVIRTEAAYVALTLPEKAVGPIAVGFGQPTSGGPLIGHAMLPYPGTWYVRITVRVDSFDEYSATTTYKVH